MRSADHIKLQFKIDLIAVVVAQAEAVITAGVIVVEEKVMENFGKRNVQMVFILDKGRT